MAFTNLDINFYDLFLVSWVHIKKSKQNTVIFKSNSFNFKDNLYTHLFPDTEPTISLKEKLQKIHEYVVSLNYLPYCYYCHEELHGNWRNHFCINCQLSFCSRHLYKFAHRCKLTESEQEFGFDYMHKTLLNVLSERELLNFKNMIKKNLKYHKKRNLSLSELQTILKILDKEDKIENQAEFWREYSLDPHSSQYISKIPWEVIKNLYTHKIKIYRQIAYNEYTSSTGGL